MFDNWRGTWRRDGAKVMLTPSGAWVVLPGDDAAVLTNCPCCNAPFPTKRSAMIVADREWPLAEIPT